MVSSSPLHFWGRRSFRLASATRGRIRRNGHGRASSKMAVSPFRQAVRSDSGQDKTESWLQNEKRRDEFYENQFKTLYLGSGGSGGYRYQWRHVTSCRNSIFPEPRPGLFKKQEQDYSTTSKVCAKAKMTMRIIGTTARRGTSKKTKTRNRTKPATRRAEAIEVIVSPGRSAKGFQELRLGSGGPTKAGTPVLALCSQSLYCPGSKEAQNADIDYHLDSGIRLRRRLLWPSHVGTGWRLWHWHWDYPRDYPDCLLAGIQDLERAPHLWCPANLRDEKMKTIRNKTSDWSLMFAAGKAK